MESGYDLAHLAREAQIRWLKPLEVFFILQNCDDQQLNSQVPHRPAGGSLFLYNKRVLKYFRKDGHSWRKRKDQRTTAEAHERLKVGNVEALNCYYTRGEENPNLYRRCFWMLDPAYDHIVLVQYREVGQGRQETGSFGSHQPDYSLAFDESYELHSNESSPVSVEISSRQVHKKNGVNQFYIEGIKDEAKSSSSPDLNQALRRLEQQLSLDDDLVEEISVLGNENGNTTDYLLSFGTQEALGTPIYQQIDDMFIQHQPAELKVETEAQFEGQDYGSAAYLVNPSKQHPYETAGLCDSAFFDEDVWKMSLESRTCSTFTPKQKFTIHEISPEWCYTSEGAKIIIVGSFLTDPTEGVWACMIGETEVPVHIIQEGVICCLAPPNLQGIVNICITSGNQECCSEIRKFEYRSKPEVCLHNDPPETEAKSLEELLLLLRLVQILLPDKLIDGVGFDSVGKSGANVDIWTSAIDSLLDGTLTSSSTIYWILQELLKDKLNLWLSFRPDLNNQENGRVLSKKEQGIIHIISGLGFEWALQPILNSGVHINFRDINGWTALHWAAKFGREKMVAALLASGASAGAVTDPNSQDPNGKTPATIAAASGHSGLAGYLSEIALTTHLSSLIFDESDQSKALAAVETERTLDGLSDGSSFPQEDHVSMKHTLAAVRNAAQAAARIQAAFRAHSFLKRQQKEAAALYADANGDEFSLLENNIQCFAAATKLPHRNTREHQLAALSIQKKYKGWKGRKDFIAFRQKVVKIQAHVRGYQVRKRYKVCWAVGILDKAILRWRRHGVGLRGFRNGLDEDESEEEEEEDILKVFRKQNVEAAIDEAVSRVVSMVKSQTAREQYHRLLQKFLQAKAELDITNSETPHGKQ